ncbi:C4b-binding protein alpha chain-like isoform X3 [Clinocottus analis]|uniref:C4b-binding protein alpha chain-like isoform X3 n=1 Tax=Clinocottus analis TaxID=304258 RepID=UPI0035C04949
MSVTYVLLLSFLGFAIHSQAQTCSPPVAGEHMTLKDNFSGLQTFQNGDKVSFGCDLGYTPGAGSTSITCTAGSWSPLTLKCQKRNCGPADEVANGDIDYSDGTEFGNKIVVTCKTGYTLVGKNTIFCGAQGWLDRMPECEVVVCLRPQPVKDAIFAPIRETYEYGDVVQYTCHKDFTLSGSRSSSCSEDGTFKPASPTCVTVQCKDPDIKNANWAGGSRPPHKYMSTVSFDCITGYTMKGARTQTCGLDSQWSPGLPTCQLVQCQEPKIQNADRVEGSQPPYQYKSTVTFKCISGYTLTGSRTQTCETGGQWSPGLPTCRLHTDSTDAPPGNDGNAKAIGLGVGLTILIGIILTVCGCYFCGVPAIIKDKRRSRRSSPDTVVPKEEAVALA